MKVCSIIIATLFFFFLQSCVTNKTGHYFLRETKPFADSNKVVKNVLIIGIGSSTSRIFMDDLSQRIISRFKKLNIQSSYSYLGNNYADAIDEMSNLQKNFAYDAYLIFSPKDSSNIAFINDKPAIPLSPGMPIHIQHHYLVYHQKFEITLLPKNFNLRSYWSALLTVNCDLRSNAIHSSLSKKICSQFKKVKK